MSTGSPTAERYGDALGEIYDLMYPWEEGQRIARRLASLVPPGARALELGVGSGRVALAAAREGLRVHGIEGSLRMIDRLTVNDPGGTVGVTHGDMATTIVEREAFDLVYVVCNTLFMLTPGDQLAALQRAREQLAPDGLLVVEVYDPSPFHALDRPTVQTRHLSHEILMIDTITTDPVEQVLVEIHTTIRPGSVDTFVEVSSYRWPRELDLAARLAGLEPVSREGGWAGEPYVASSPSHVSVYRARSEA